ncbi:MAG: serine hydrolase domain-containing protein [Gemmatimonadaceae bacterium]
MRPAFVTLPLLCITAVACQAPSARAVGRDLPSWIDHGDLVGAEVLVIRRGATLLHQAYGWNNREAGAPMEVNSIFSLASLTKPVTALAALILVDEGKLSLDSPVSQYIPNFRGEPRATVQDLLAHTSGDGGEHGNGGYNVYEFSSLSAWVEDWATSEASATYSEFSYSNFNYAALGYIIERVSGVGLGEFVTERILRPLGMNNSFVSFTPDSAWADRVPASYVWSSESNRYEVFWTPDRPQRWDFFPGALGLWGTAKDYARFVTLWLDLGVAGGRQLVSADVIRAALEPHGFRNGEPVYGFGWFVDALRTEGDLPLSFWHGGGDGTLALVYPGDQGIVVYLSQSERPPDHVAAFENRIGMSGLFAHPGPFMRWASTTGVRTFRLLPGGSMEYTGSFRGEYVGLESVSWEVEVREVAAVLDLSMGESGLVLRDHVHLVPIGDDLFMYGRYERGELVGVDPSTRARFLREAGRIVRLEVTLDGEPEYRVTRVGDAR